MKVSPELFGTDQPVALVTGSAALRVGRTIAMQLVERGYSLALHGNQSVDAGKDAVNSIRKHGGIAEFFAADLQQPDAPADLVDRVVKHFGRLDVVVNSAAIWYPTPFEELTQDQIEKYLQINMVSSFVVAQQAGLQMVRQEKGGAIVNLGDWAPRRPYTNYAAYFLSKGNLPTMTRTLAVELAERNPSIRVNAVLPGPVMIPHDLDENLRTQIIEATLVKREGSPKNVADACVSLIENDFITGVCLPVDGGRSIYSPYNPV